MTELFRRIHYLLNRRRLDGQLADEMEFHREMAAQAGGQTFGNTLRLQEESRDAWGWTWLDRLFQDLRYAWRMIVRSPGFTLAAVLMLAIGIGINVAAFGFFNIVLFKPLPIREPETLLRFHRIAQQNYASDLPYPAMAFYREHSKTLTSLLALDVASLILEGERHPLKSTFVTCNFFDELGGRAALGRLLNPAMDERGDAEPVAVLSHDFWKRQFGADPAVIGRTLRLNGKPVLVVGVVSDTFSGLTFSVPDVWLPLERQPYFIEGSRLLTNVSADSDGVDVWGRLRSGYTVRAAEDELHALTATLRKQYPDEIWENERIVTEPGGYAQNAGGRERGNAPSPGLRGRLYSVVYLVSALTLLILGVACANLGSLLLARGVARQREMMIRTAIGAGRRRLMRQLLTESVLLAFLGSTAAMILSYWVLHRMMRFAEAPAWLDLTPDWRVVLFTIATAFAATILFGLTPALQVVRQRQQATIARHFLVGAQVAASCVLLIVSALLVRAVKHAMSNSPGFEYKQVISIDPRLNFHGYSDGAARAYLETLQNRLRDLPGVESVSFAVSPPLGNRSTTASGEKDGKTFPIHINRVDPEFLATMKIPILRGRNLVRGETRAVVVSESLARRLWPGEDPLGQQFSLGSTHFPVVGVSGNARVVALSDTDAVEVYQLVEDRDSPSVAVLVRLAGPVESLAQTAVALARSVDPKVIPSVQTLQSAFARKLENTEKSALVVSLLGALALLLACLGIVGVVAYAVSQRTKEIGIRMALGADPIHVIGAILRQFRIPVLGGLIVGAAGAAAVSQLLRKELYGLSHLDPLAYVGATLLFVITAAVAAVLPARRALRVDPMHALRYE